MTRKFPRAFVSKTVNDTSWKPRTSWLIVLRTQDGLRDVRSFKGDYAEAKKRRDEYLSNSLYASAWLIEERDKTNFTPRQEKPHAR